MTCRRLLHSGQVWINHYNC